MIESGEKKRITETDTIEITVAIATATESDRTTTVPTVRATIVDAILQNLAIATTSLETTLITVIGISDPGTLPTIQMTLSTRRSVGTRIPADKKMKSLHLKRLCRRSLAS